MIPGSIPGRRRRNALGLGEERHFSQDGKETLARTGKSEVL